MEHPPEVVTDPFRIGVPSETGALATPDRRQSCDVVVARRDRASGGREVDGGAGVGDALRTERADRGATRSSRSSRVAPSRPGSRSPTRAEPGGDARRRARDRGVVTGGYTVSTTGSSGRGSSRRSRPRPASNLSTTDPPPLGGAVRRAGSPPATATASPTSRRPGTCTTSSRGRRSIAAMSCASPPDGVADLNRRDRRRVRAAALSSIMEDMSPDDATAPRYVEPGWFTRHLVNPNRRAAHPRRHQRLGFPRAARPRPHQRRVAQQPGTPADRRGHALPGVAPGSQPVGAEPAGRGHRLSSAWGGAPRRSAPPRCPTTRRWPILRGLPQAMEGRGRRVLRWRQRRLVRRGAPAHRARPPGVPARASDDPDARDLTPAT